MTDEKKNSATHWLVILFDNGNDCQTAYKVLNVFDNEGDARKFAEEQALEQPRVKFGLYQKTGTALADLQVEWKGVNAR